jgi:hypothetical protein
LPVVSAAIALVRTPGGRPRVKFFWKKHEPRMPSGQLGGERPVPHPGAEPSGVVGIELCNVELGGSLFVVERPRAVLLDDEESAGAGTLRTGSWLTGPAELALLRILGERALLAASHHPALGSKARAARHLACTLPLGARARVSARDPPPCRSFPMSSASVAILARTALDGVTVGVEVCDARVRAVTAGALRRRLVGRRLTGTRRHGK